MDTDRMHKTSYQHREAVSAATQCGCFFCIRVFTPSEITEWCDDGQTALCPHCGIDAVLPNVTDTETLMAMSARWFRPVEDNP